MNLRQILEQETGIIWFDDPTKYSYLREEIYPVCNNYKLPMNPYNRKRSYVIIGCATVKKNISKGEFIIYDRRFWYLKPIDFQFYKNEEVLIPEEAVVPSSIVVGKESVYLVMGEEDGH